ncbi:MAG: hypothetical protein KBT03_11165 [Bacteroidales bacterium]|nr:hypothetical protein [Candidatus Scybalousia scybalohippi]
MAKDSTIIIQKDKSNTSVDIEDRFGIVVVEMPLIIPTEIKEVFEQNYPDEDGVDVYNSNDGVKFDKYTINIQMGIKGKISYCNSNLKNFLDYITSTDGTLFSFYSPWVCDGKAGSYFGGVSDFDYFRDDTGESFMIFNMSIVVTKPKSSVTLLSNGNLSINQL